VPGARTAIGLAEDHPCDDIGTMLEPTAQLITRCARRASRPYYFHNWGRQLVYRTAPLT
jgi:hypothetical protein